MSIALTSQFIVNINNTLIIESVQSIFINWILMKNILIQFTLFFSIFFGTKYQLLPRFTWPACKNHLYLVFKMAHRPVFTKLSLAWLKAIGSNFPYRFENSPLIPAVLVHADNPYFSKRTSFCVVRIVRVWLCKPITNHLFYSPPFL